MELTSPSSLRRLTTFGCLAAVAVAVSACGGSSGSSSSETEPATSATTTSSGSISAAAGKTVFTDTCGGCHTLSDAGTSGATGPNLDDLKPDMALVVKQVTNGGGGMPSFASQLSKTQIQSVAKYVSSVAGSGGGTEPPAGGTP